MSRDRSSAGWAVRGVMADPARLTERHEFYFELLEWMAEWGLNTLWWHFADDEGFTLKLSGHPELASPRALSKAKMKRLLDKAGQLGIDVVPEVESLGHTRWITALDQYAELADGDEFGFNAICPSHPRTLPLLEEIITEVAELFESPYFHAGMDEVNLGDCPRCRRRGHGKPSWWVYAQHVKAIHRIVRSAGKEMILWADHIEKDPAMLKVLPADLILAHWHYRQVRPEPIRRSLKAGFRVIGCPALCHHGDVIMSNQANYENMDAMTALFAKLHPAGRVLGIVNTWWTSWRGLRDAYLPAVAYTGEMLRARTAVGKTAFARRFGRRSFGVDSQTLAKATWEMHALMPSRTELLAALFDSPADMHDALNLAEQKVFAERERHIGRCLEALRKAARRARRHKHELKALILAGEVAELCFRRVREFASAAAEYRKAELAHARGRPAQQVIPSLNQALETLQRMRADVASAVKSVATEWDRTRYPGDPKKGLKARWRRSDDALLSRLAGAERFNAKLIKDLARAIKRYRRTGQFPGGV